MRRSYLFTSESVAEGHPDKVADQVSDAILDAYLAVDPQAKVACETLITSGRVVVAGEVFSQGLQLDHAALEVLVRQTIREIGYTADSLGFDADSCSVQNLLHTQSANIRDCVEQGDCDLGAGDQGLMFGFATRETPELMPLPIQLAHQLVRRQAEMRRNGTLPWLGPDAKSQVTVRYADGVPQKVVRVVLSTQHAPDQDNRTIREAVIQEIIEPVLPPSLRDASIDYLINPSGRFEIGGPHADTGLTGRKIIVDTYGGSCPHGGGAFSGKDPTKVDRSAAYAARHLAKNLVAAGFADRCTVQVAYAIGRAEPVSVALDFHGTGRVEEDAAIAAVGRVFDLRPAGIIRSLDLRRPIYRRTAAFGHFGREYDRFTWEERDKVAELQEALAGATVEANAN
jgi:S-adenosylmethionine synthetase